MISIHVPREGHDHHRQYQGGGTSTFQSTCPARGTTAPPIYLCCQMTNFNPRAPRGARLIVIAQAIHYFYFNPRAPRGARLRRNTKIIGKRTISIHVPREGHDGISHFLSKSRGNFNPRAPRGARRASRVIRRRNSNFNPRAPRGARHPLTRVVYPVAEFQSTCPARGTTS